MVSISFLHINNVAYDVFKEKGYSINFVSPSGGPSIVDEDSAKKYANDKLCMHFIADTSAMQKLNNTTEAKTVDPKTVDALYIEGGIGMLYDVEHIKQIDLHFI